LPRAPSLSFFSYDLPLLTPGLTSRFKEREGVRVRLSLQGSKVRWLKVGRISFQEVRRLLPEGTSLSKFRGMCGLSECKSSFPFELLQQDQAFLQAKELPPKAEQWRSRLGGVPSQESVDEARALFSSLQCENVGDYLRHYLKQDCLMLGKGFQALRDSFYSLFRLDVVDSRKFTISSLSALASQAYLFRNKKVGFFTPQEPKIYSLLRQGLRGGECLARRRRPHHLSLLLLAGLTSVYRTAAGKDADFSNFVKIHQEHERWRRRRQQDSKAAGAPSQRPPEEEEEEDSVVEARLRKINGHRPDHATDPQNADYLNYYDVVGLYSHSGENFDDDRA
jgi:DNA polymerase type B, organellar and viral